MTVAAPRGTERIARAFARAKAEGRLAVIIYLTVGYPDRGSTAPLVRAAVDGGADLIELGVPFSDPLADGTTVQRANEIALADGVTLADCLAVGGELVSATDAPVLLMGYTNPFEQYGFHPFARDAAAAGIAGVIVPDMPAEESAVFGMALAQTGLARIDLFAPTTPDDRLARLAADSRGFVYAVSLTGVTGARRAVGSDVEGFVRRVRAHTALPIALGFGISEPSHVAALRGVVDGVVIGSAAIDVVTGATADRPAALRDFVRGLADAGRS